MITRSVRSGTLFLWGCLVCAIPFASAAPPRIGQSGQGIIVAAHYAPWFAGSEGGWFNRVGDKKIKTAWTPLLGYYDNRKAAVLSKHIEWANAHSINTFMIEWSGVWSDAYPHSFESVVHPFLTNPDFKKIKFFFVYAIPGAFEKKGQGVPKEIDFDDKAVVDKFVSDFKYAAKTYFGQPNHLKFGGKPVIYIWGLGAARGDFMGAVAKLRRAVKTAAGMDLYIIGEEVSWGIVPDLSRTPIWDAVMPYIMLKVRNPVRNYKLAASIPEIVPQYRHWRNSCEDLGIGFIPGVFAGQNGAGAVWHYDEKGKLITPVVARDPASFKTFIQEAKAFLDPDIKMIFLCSWSEWNEGTNIEPSKEFGFDYLDVVKKYLSRYSPAKPPKDIVKFQFKRLWNPGGDSPRLLAAAFDYVEFIDASGRSLLKIDIGTASARKDLGFGWFPDEGAWGTEAKNFAWSGEKQKYATVHLDLPAGATVIRFRALQIEPPQSIKLILNSKLIAEFPVETPFAWTVYEAGID